MEKSHSYDVVIAGGGPAGATAGLILARKGRRVLILEKSSFPRFHVGESLLPQGFELIDQLGLREKLLSLTHVDKYGAEFVMGNDFESTLFDFSVGFVGGENRTFNIERAGFDKMLLDEAAVAGCEVRCGHGVRRINTLQNGHVEVEIAPSIESNRQHVSASWFIDATGQSALLGRQLGVREPVPLHRKIACFGHFEGVERLSGREAGYPTIVICTEGWFWLIPIDEKRTSIGLVLDADTAKSVGVPAREMLLWGIERCPVMCWRTRDAVFPKQTHTMADFSYYCRPFAGSGYFMVGDAAFFLDPVFSSGISLGMTGAMQAAALIDQVMTGKITASSASRTYQRSMNRAARTFFRLIDLFYDHSFRELFLNGAGPLKVERAVISLLAGHIFPRPAFAIRWRMWVFEAFVAVNRFVPLVGRRTKFSLLAQSPDVTKLACFDRQAVGV